jgi:capsular exopolysaccharide synthesis family protein
VARTFDDIEQDLADTPSSGPSTGLLAVLWRRKALVILGLFCGLVAGFLYHLQRPAVYQSRAQLLVLKKRTDPMPMMGDGRASFIEDYVATQVTLLKSQVILGLAAKKLTGEQLQVPLDPSDEGRLYFLTQGLIVARDKDTGNPITGGSSILNLTFRGPSSADSPKIINSVVNAYGDYIRGQYSGMTNETLKIVADSLDATQKELARREEEYEKLHAQTTTQSQASPNELKSRINQNEQQLTMLSLEHIRLSSRLKTIEMGLKQIDEKTGVGPNGMSRAALLAVLDSSATRKAEMRGVEDALITLRLQEEDMLERLGKDHPDVVALRKRINLLSKHVLTVDPSAGAATGGKEVGRLDNIDIYLRSTQTELQQNQEQQLLLNQRLLADRAEAIKLDTFAVKEKILFEHCERLRKELNNLSDRKRQIDLSRDLSGFDATKITEPKDGELVSPILWQSLALLGFVGLMLGSGLAYLAEVTDKSFRTPEEIRQRLKLPVIGHVPPIKLEKMAGQPLPIDASLVTHFRPKSLESEAYRGVRTALYFSTQGRGHQVIQVTSPNASEGKSTLAANLAISIAQSGKRVILIDADFRKPRVDKLFKIESALGLATVIAGERPLREAIQFSEVPNLSLLPCGPRPANPAELLTSPQFVEVLAEIRQQFDFVIIDTPPVLAVSDPSIVAPRADGVLLTLQISKNGRPAAERAKEALTSLGANLLGVVVNGYSSVRPASQAYEYGYGYGYDDDVNASYHNTPDDVATKKG